jgi:hypothetical protein
MTAPATIARATRPLLASLLAACLALTPLGAQRAEAQATTNDQLSQLLAGAATLAILGLAWKADKDHDRKTQVQRAPSYPHRFDNPPRYRDRTPYPAYRHGHAPRKEYRNAYRKIVPSGCLREIPTSHGVERFFARPCLEQSMRNASQLPRDCARVFRGYRGPVTGYVPGCLHRYGWRRG